MGRTTAGGSRWTGLVEGSSLGTSVGRAGLAVGSSLGTSVGILVGPDDGIVIVGDAVFTGLSVGPDGGIIDIDIENDAISMKLSN